MSPFSNAPAFFFKMTISSRKCTTLNLKFYTHKYINTVLAQDTGFQSTGHAYKKQHKDTTYAIR